MDLINLSHFKSSMKDKIILTYKNFKLWKQ